jgi:CRP-like cAMP-binding protein
MLPPCPEEHVVQKNDQIASPGFLSSLAPDDRLRLQPHLKPVSLRSRSLLHEIGQPIQHCYFVDHGMVSLLVRMEDGDLIEAGVVGREGMAGLSAVLGADQAQHTAMVQLPGTGVQVPAVVVRDLMLDSPTFLDRVLRFSQALNSQLSQSAACNARHSLPERLARWLLMAHDRAGSDRLELTQEFISMMLAVRRSGVTIAAHTLQATQAIEYHRGSILVRDRQLLEQASCECYEAICRQTRRLLDWPSERAGSSPDLRQAGA